MIKNLLNRPVDQRYLPNIQNAFSDIAKSDSLIKKITNVVKLIILLPWLVVKDSTFHLINFFKKDSRKISFTDRFFSSLTRSQVKIIKTALAGASILGVIYYNLNLSPNKPPVDSGLLRHWGWISVAAIFGVTFVVKGIKDARESLFNNDDHDDRRITSILKAKAINLNNPDIEGVRLIEAANDAIDSLMSSKIPTWKEFSLTEFFEIIALKLEAIQLESLRTKINKKIYEK